MHHIILHVSNLYKKSEKLDSKFIDTIAFHTVLTSYSTISYESPVLLNEGDR